MSVSRELQRQLKRRGIRKLRIQMGEDDLWQIAPAG
jgi:hypothetical protein